MSVRLIQAIADRIADDINNQYELDEFFLREVIGVMYRRSIATAHEENVIPNVDAYLTQFCNLVRQDIKKTPNEYSRDAGAYLTN